MYYGDKRESKVNICHTLQKLGWKIYGYHEDQSDSMTDYYHPASWGGIATKNGFVLCVDIGSYNVNSYSGKKIERQTIYSIPDSKIEEKISKLKALYNDRGASQGEKDGALKSIERLRLKQESEQMQAELSKEVLYTYPVFQENPPRCNWHIEKGGTIIAKGNGAFQFSNLPWGIDPLTGEPDSTYHRKYEITESEQKAMKKFKTFVKKVEAVTSIKVGDADEEPIYKTITVTEYKKELKAVEIDIGNLDEELEPGVSFKLKSSFNGGRSKGTVYRITDDTNGMVTAHRLNRKLNKELRGWSTQANFFNCTYDQFKRFVEKGAITIVSIEEVSTPYNVEKCVKVEPEKKKTTYQKKEQSDNKLLYTYEIDKDIDTRDNSPIFVVKIKDSLSKDEFNKLRTEMRNIEGYYSRFKHGFIFKEDPRQLLDGLYGEQIKQDTQLKSESTKKKNGKQLAEKINKQISGYEKKIQGLSGQYKTNTYKRMREQEERENKIRSYQIDIDILKYLLLKLELDGLSEFETKLITATFRADMHSYYLRHKHYTDIIKEKRMTTARPVEFPENNPNNSELQKFVKRLNSGGIHNTDELIKCIELYGKIIDEAIRPVDQTQQILKKKVRECKMMQKGDIQFTPTEIAEIMVEYAKINSDSLVLEPSAAIGNIADEIQKYTKNIDVIERIGAFREVLELKGYNLVGSDFLEYQTDKRYDAIIMNPPFSKNQDIRHIQHAYTLLKPDGVLVAITSPHWTFSSDRASHDFRNWLEDIEHTKESLERNTFEMTSIQSQLLVLYKSDEELEVSA